MQDPTGTIKWLDQSYGLSFIAPDHSGQAVFAILNELQPPLDPRDLIIGQRIRYTAVRKAYGPRATFVEPL